MKILVVDGQGGSLGAQLIKSILAKFPKAELTAVGTNAMATSAMLKAGADNAATGENPVVVACRTADIIVGPVGIVAADSLNGEITPKMALAVGQANATRILIPMNRCDILVAGVKNASVNTLIDDAVDKIGEML
ncbi:MAG: DUF3842 family protein [Lachnospiraceae bacterium]|nr:DUF3842 family protein [Lachnospiraceae bacterium]